MSTPQDTSYRFGNGATPPGAPSLTAVTEIMHQGTVDEPSDLVVLCGYGAESMDLGFWPIPPEVDHPTDVLVGWHPPEWASVVGLVTSGEARSADSIDTVRITVTVAADQQTATVLQRAGHAPETLSEPPQGWGADALRRCLGLATPPPAHGLHICVEGSWLREIIGLLADAAVHGARVTWDQIALVHPLHPSGWPAPPSQLRAATAALELESSWDRIAKLTAPEFPPQPVNPPGGTVVALADWFDAGSFSRWSIRRIPDVDDLLFEVLDLLEPEVAGALLDALLSTTSNRRGA